MNLLAQMISKASDNSDDRFRGVDGGCSVSTTASVAPLIVTEVQPSMPHPVYLAVGSIQRHVIQILGFFIRRGRTG